MKVALKTSEEKNVLSFFGHLYFLLYLALSLQSFRVVRSIQTAGAHIPDLSLCAYNSESN